MMTTTSPDAVPQDVFAEAYRIAAMHSGLEPADATPLIDAIASAIMNERERCAVLVECVTAGRGYAGGPARSNLVKRTNPSFTAQVIAAAIRAGA